MRLLRRMLPAVVGCLGVALAFGAGATAAGRPSVVQTSSYVWVQPWSSATVVPSSEQLPASVGTLVAARFVPASSYKWAQPWGVAGRSASVQPPSWVPTAD